MTPDAFQRRDGYPGPPAATGPAGGTTLRSGARKSEAAAARHWEGGPRPSHTAPRPRAQARRTSEDAGIVEVIPLLAILVVAVAGVYVAWHQGSAGGAEGGAIAGAALLAAAVVRLFLPDRLAGLLAVRSRMTDAVTLAAFGAGLLIAGLVLPR
jgi:Protein of unknown function (DUF3017)